MKTEPDASPGRPAAPIASSSHHGYWNVQEQEDASQRSQDEGDPGRRIDKLGSCRQTEIRDAEHNHRLEEPREEFLSRAVICESVSCAFCLTEEIPANLGFRPKVIPAQCHECQEDIDDLYAEEGLSAAVKGELQCLVRSSLLLGCWEALVTRNVPVGGARSRSRRNGIRNLCDRERSAASSA